MKKQENGERNMKLKSKESFKGKRKTDKREEGNEEERKNPH